MVRGGKKETSNARNDPGQRANRKWKNSLRPISDGGYKGSKKQQGKKMFKCLTREAHCQPAQEKSPGWMGQAVL